MGQKRKNDEIIYSENIKRLKLEAYEGGATIEDIPVEIMWKIIEYLDSDTFLSLTCLCRSISKTLNVVFYHCYNTIPKKIMSAREKLYDKLCSSGADDNDVRMDVTKALLHLIWIETELTTLESVILRYNVNSESAMFSHLWPILKEILDSVQTLMTEERPLVGDMIGCCADNHFLRLPLWSKFIEEFDSDLEPTFGQPFPFEVKAIDILSCCPASNTSITLKRSKDGTVDLRAFFQIQDSLTESFITEFDIIPPNIGNKKALLKMFRYIVRKSNSMYLTKILNDVKTLKDNINDELEIPLNYKYRQLLSSLYKPITSIENRKNGSVSFTRQNTYNVSSNFMELSLEKDMLNISDIPLIAVYPRLFNIERTQNISYDSANATMDVEDINPAFRIKWFKKD